MFVKHHTGGPSSEAIWKVWSMVGAIVHSQERMTRLTRFLKRGSGGNIATVDVMEEVLRPARTPFPYACISI